MSLFETREYWPFPVLLPEQRTEHHKRVIDFLDTAFREGFSPCVFNSSNYSATAPSGRTGDILHRGANRYWEVILGDVGGAITSFFVDGFAVAGQALLQWLRGTEAENVKMQCNADIVSKPGTRGW